MIVEEELRAYLRTHAADSLVALQEVLLRRVNHVHARLVRQGRILVYATLAAVVGFPTGTDDPRYAFLLVMEGQGRHERLALEPLTDAAGALLAAIPRTAQGLPMLDAWFTRQPWCWLTQIGVMFQPMPAYTPPPEAMYLN